MKHKFIFCLIILFTALNVQNIILGGETPDTGGYTKIATMSGLPKKPNSLQKTSRSRSLSDNPSQQKNKRDKEANPLVIPSVLLKFSYDKKLKITSPYHDIRQYLF